VTELSFEDARFANFFWHGNALSVYEHVCISSFLKSGFSVRVFSYGNLKLPEGVSLFDAEIIFPASQINRYTQEGQRANLAAFSDVFRYHLLSKVSGWWFDTDVFSLLPVADFYTLLKRKELGICLGYETDDCVNGAVLYLKEPALLKYLHEEVDRAGSSFRWGTIGPKLLTRMEQYFSLQNIVEPTSSFYPIGWQEYARLLDPKYNEWCRRRAENSFSIHLWNEMRKRFEIPNDILPPKGSFLYDLFTSTFPSLKNNPALSFEYVDKKVESSLQRKDAFHDRYDLE
jgi:hypothetical protein